MRTSILGGLALVAASVAVAGGGVGCSGTAKSSGFGSSSGSGSSGGSSGGSGSGGTSSGGIGTFGDDGGSSSGGGGCDPNPANYDIPGNNCDDDGDGQVDNTPTCDREPVALGYRARLRERHRHLPGRDVDEVGHRLGDVHAGLRPRGGTPNVGAARHPAQVRRRHQPQRGPALGVLSSGYAFECDDANPSSTCNGSSGQQGGDPYFKGSSRPDDRSGHRAPRLPQGCGGLPRRIRHQRRHRRNLADQGSRERPGAPVRLRLLLGRVARVRVHGVQRLVRRVAAVHCVHRHGRATSTSRSTRRATPSASTTASSSTARTNATDRLRRAGRRPPRPRAPAGPSELQGTGFYNLGTYCTGRARAAAPPAG